MTLTKTVDIPADRRVRFDFEVPLEIPEGKTEIIIQFPVLEKAQPTEKPKMYIPKDSNGKIRLTKEMIKEMLRNSPHTRALSGILSGMEDIDLDKIRMERLAKYL